MITSDHHSVTLNLTFPQHSHTSKIWTLDSNLLTDKERICKLSTIITNYFQDNDTPDTSTLTQWEAHKCVIRGQLISLASALKHEKRKHMNDLLAKIQTLERAHKLYLAQHTHHELTETRKLLLEELGQKMRSKYTLSQKLFYEYSNKSSHLLAQALCAKKQNKATVHQLKTSSGNTLKSCLDIAQEFEHFYADLYNLSASETQMPTPSPRSSLIQNFL